MNSVEHCLIIDNNPTRVGLVQKTLKDNRITSNIKVTVNCGIALVYLKEVREKLRNKKTLVIMNVHTPFMSGMELMDELKSTTYCKSEELLFVALTDTLDDSSREACKGKGIHHFISSQFTADNLSSLIPVNDVVPQPAEMKEPEVTQASGKSKKKNKTIIVK